MPLLWMRSATMGLLIVIGASRPKKSQNFYLSNAVSSLVIANLRLCRFCRELQAEGVQDLEHRLKLRLALAA